MTALRISGRFTRSDPVTIIVDGLPVHGYRGEMLAAVLLASDVGALRLSPRNSGARSAFCLMGVCQECVVHVDGVLQQSCQVAIQSHMTVELRGSL